MSYFRRGGSAARLCLAAVTCVGWSASVAAQTITEFPLTSDFPAPNGITSGPDGALYFAEILGNRIGRISTTGTITLYPDLTPGRQPNSITAGPDGALWFTEANANMIGRITTAGTVTEYPVPTANSQPGSVTAGPDGALWFTEVGGKIGRITTAGTITEYPVATASSGVFGVTAGPDGALWFTEDGGNKIGRITTSGALTEYPLPTANSGPQGITAGADGALWFTEEAGGRIGRITTHGEITEFAIATPNSQPLTITAGPDGALWFGEHTGGNIGRITTTGVITEYPLPQANAYPTAVTAGPDRAVWFTEQHTSKIGRITPPPSTSPLFAATLPSSRSVQVGNAATAFATIINTGLTATGCGIAPVTSVPANFQFQTTDPATNALTGSVNTRVSIAAGGAQTFVIGFMANAPFVPTNVVLGYACDNVDAAATIVGVNTLLLTFSATPVPDMIAVGLTPSNDGYSHTGGPTGTGIFVLATTNIGSSAPLTARARPSNSSMPLTTAVCQTNPSNGQCLSPPAPTVTVPVNQNDQQTWTAFLQASGTMLPDPANSRVFFEFLDSGGVVRGSTSTAVTTQ